ncbi:threonine ammonia-lyase [Fodinicola acaciae]|uniref:threonine ammonia-lyase n=1 Tax=Fodinicola acaciae TaxID=2681555 RepID=UPI0013D30CDE|nr:pyridoxal-phosphate dependent enzyme [Fodinicola acaciae]
MPTFADVVAAADRIAGHLPQTPMWSYPLLDAAVGADVLVKQENTQPVGAFKVRGGINLMAELSGGVCTYSTGNHALSIAYAARLAGNACTVVMPANPNPDKLAAVEALGARVVLADGRMEEAQRLAGELAERDGLRLVSPANEPALIAGVATAYAEILRAEPELDAIFVPVGSGTGAAGAVLAAAELAPACQIIAVQSAAAPAAYASWLAGECVSRPNRTDVDGLATGRGFELPQRLIAGRLADFLLVSDADIRAAQRLMLSATHLLAEGAGAAALAGLLGVRDKFAGKRVAVVCTGGNASSAELRALLG